MIAGCGASTNVDLGKLDPGPAGHSVGGYVQGLVGSGLVLRNAGADDLAVARSGPFKFGARLPAGSNYAVTVFAQPESPVQTCTVGSSQGTMGVVDIIDVAVRCLNGAPTVITGSISGLTGAGLILELNGLEDLQLPAGTSSFTFATRIARGAPLDVAVKRQPAGPLQTCTVAGSSTAGAGPLAVTCTDNPKFAMSGTVTGLLGSGLKLQSGSGEILSLSPGATAFKFETPVIQAGPFKVTVKQQPANPRQTCVVTPSSGTVGAGPVALAVNCDDGTTYPVGGLVRGLKGAGLVLHEAGGDDAPVASDGRFVFPTPLPTGATWLVTVAHQPTGPRQTCTVSEATGTVAGAEVTSIGVDCADDPYFPVGGFVTGLAGSGLVLRNLGGDDLSVGANGAFSFDTPWQTGQRYDVSVKTQPSGPLQTCAVTAGAGVVGDGEVTTVQIACTTNPYFGIGGQVRGLLGGGLVLHDDAGGDDLPIAADGSFTFASRLQATQHYSVSVAAQPLGPYQLCSVAGGDGVVVGDVVGIVVTCVTSPFYSVGGTVTGLKGSGLVLQDDGGDELALAADGAFTFAARLQQSVPYIVRVAQQPSGPFQTCTVAGGLGTVGAADVGSVRVTCVDNPSFRVAGTTSGLTSAGLVLKNLGADTLSVASSGPFAFAGRLQQGQPYRISVGAQPAGNFCAVTSGGEGVMGAADASVQVTCAGTAFASVKVQVSGLLGGGLVLRHDGNDDLAVASDGAYSFADQQANGQGYAVTVKAQPTGPLQTCTPGANAAGTLSGDATVTITCVTNAFFNLGGVVTGVSGTGLVLVNNGGDPLPITASGSFTFPGRLQGTEGYVVSVAAPPNGPLQTCTVSNGRGVVGSADVGDVFVSCQTNPFLIIGGTVRGLLGVGLALQNEGGNDVLVDSDGFFLFTTLLQAGQSYAVTVKTQPTAPLQTCTVTNGAGLAVRAVTNIQVDCVSAPAFTVGGAVSGLLGAGLQLTNNGVDVLNPTQDGAFSFATAVQTSRPYLVAVKTQPTAPFQTCRVTNGAGTIQGAAVSNAIVACTNNALAVGGTITGLPAGASVTLMNNGFDARTTVGSGTGATPIPFSFVTPVATGRGWSAALLSQTGPVNCAVTSGATGTVANAAITSISVSCVPAFTVGGTLSTLAGAGLQLTNSTTGEVLTVAKGAASFVFARPVSQALGYSVSVTAQPAGVSQVCAVSAGTPSPAAGNPTANVTDLAIGCATSSFAVGGSVTGLPAGASVTLLDNGGDSLTVNGAGTGGAPALFTFATSLASGASYAATISATAGPVSCALSAGSGTVTSAAVSNLAVACVPTFAISGTVAGLGSAGLQLRNGPTAETISLAASATSFAFTKPVTQAQGYAITVVAQPTGPALICGPSGSTPAPIRGNPTANVSTIAIGCAAAAFTVGGKVSGLPAGASVTLQDNGNDTVAVAGSGTGAAQISFTLPLTISTGGLYSIAVSAQAGAVSCAVTSGGAGTMAGAAVTDVQVTCTPAFLVGGTLATYAGTGLQLTNAATGETLSPARGATTFTFAKRVTQAQGYAVAIAAQPNTPAQTCAATSGPPLSGNPTADTTNLGLTCTTTGFSVGGTVTGLPAGSSVTLLDNAADATTITGAGDGSAAKAFAFPTAIKSGATYAVTVSATTGPVVCAAAGASGTVAAGAVSSVAISCVPGFFLSGTLTGYAGAGLQLRNGPTNETISIPAGQTTFAFTRPVSRVQGYALSVAAQPTGPVQSCAVPATSPAFPTGNPTANVTNAVVACGLATFAVGGQVQGLPAGASLVLQDNGFDNRTVNGAGDGSAAIGFTFGTAIPAGQTYAATMFSQAGPVSCALTAAATGTVVNAAITAIRVACVPAFSVSGTVSGVLGSGLQLANSTTGEAVQISPGATAFAFKKLFTQAQGYAISVLQGPVNPAQGCTVTSATPASGAPTANVTDLAYSCATSSYSVGGVVNGLPVGLGLTLRNDGGDDLRFSVGTPSYPYFAFATKLPSGQSYNVTVKTQPAGLACAARAPTGLGLVGSSNVTSVVIDCAPTHALSGKVTGYVGAGLRLSDGLDTLAVAASPGQDVPFAFPTALGRGASFRVNVAAQPGGPAQDCEVTGGSSGDGSGVMPDADEASLVVACGTPSYKVGGQVIGLNNGGAGAMVLQNGGDQLILSYSAASTSAPVSFQFANPVMRGLPYAVTVPTAPTGLVCVVRNPSGTMASADVTSVLVVCGYQVTGTFDTAAVGGTSGQLPSSGLSLSDALTPATAANGTAIVEPLDVPAGAAGFTFSEPVPRGGTCAIAITAQPSAPAQLCTLSVPSGCTGTGAPVTAPLAAKLRCVQQLELVGFPGATGSALATAADASGNLTAAGSFTGSTDLGHGARTASTFAGGSGFAAGLDGNGRRGAAASPTSASWDLIFPSASATLANAGSAKVRAASVGASGDVIAAGSFSGSVDFGDGAGPTAAAPSGSMFLARIDRSGALVWVKKFGAGAIGSLAVSATKIIAGGVYGASAGAQEDFGAAACALTASAASRDFVAGFDWTTGACSFANDLAKGVSPSGSTRPGPAVALDSLGNALAAGNAADSTGLNALAAPYLVTYDGAGKNACLAGGAGNELFQDAAAPAGDQVTAVVAGAGDAIAVAGHCQGTPKLKAKAVTCGTGASTAFVVRYLPRSSCASGQLQGPGTGGAPLAVVATGVSSKATAMAADAAGNLIVAGQYAGTPSWGAVAFFTGSAAEGQNAFVARFPIALTAPTVQAVNATASVSAAGVTAGAAGSAWLSGSWSGTLGYKGRTPALGTTAAAPEPMLVRFPAGAP